MENLLKEILSQVQNMSNELKDFRVDATQRLTKLEITLENTTNVKIQALNEDGKIIHDKLDIITNEINEIKEQVSDHDVNIQVLKNRKALK